MKKIFLSVAEDYKIVNKIILQKLSGLSGWNVINIPVKDVVEKTKKESPDIVIVFENQQICKAIKEKKRKATTLVIAISVNPIDKLKFADKSWCLEEDIEILKEYIYGVKKKNKKRILIVDDNEIIHTIIKETLKSQKYDFIDAYDGVEAIDKVSQFEPDMVLTDLNMPKKDGYEVCRWIKNNPQTGNMPVIIISSSSSDDIKEKGFDAGTDEFIAKPFTDEQLISKVEFYFSNIVRDTRSENILLADDSKTVLSILRKGLSQQGFHVFTAFNGKEGLKIAKKKSIDIVVSDIEMPLMNGFELCRNLKKDERTRSIPFIALTTKDSRGARGLGKDVGVDFFIAKPFPTDKLIVIIERFLAEKRSKIIFEREMLIASISSLAKALDERDAYTNFHSENVASYSRKLAVAMGLSDYDVETISLAGVLHDIGKIGIRDSILLKPGKLTDEEYDNIKTHSNKGASILEPIPSLKQIIPLIRHHHERFDGRGYPDGLKGDDIPLGARIIAVADTYDALTSDRSYRKKMPKKKAVGIINEVLGTQLCPECGKMFLKIMK